MQLRLLPPVGGSIPYGAVLDSLSESLITFFSGDHAGESELNRYLVQEVGLTHWILTNAGRSALSIVLMALHRLRPDSDEVVIPAYTSYSVPAAVVRAKLRVRLCDVELETLGLTSKDLSRVLSRRSLCILPNHLYGIPCQIESICDVAQEYRVPVIENAAQAMGIRGIGGDCRVSNRTDGIVFSLSRGKTIPGVGGGIIGTNHQELANECGKILDFSNGNKTLGLESAVLAALTSIFIRPSLYWIPASLPFLKLGVSIYDPEIEIARMSMFQEIFAARLLRDLNQLQHLRRRNAIRLRGALESLDDNGDAFRVVCPKDEGDYLRLPILLKDSARRERALVALNRHGLGATGGYPLAISEIPALRSHLVDSSQGCQVASWISRHLVTLPTHPGVTDSDIERMVEIFASV